LRLARLSDRRALGRGVLQRAVSGAQSALAHVVAADLFLVRGSTVSDASAAAHETPAEGARTSESASVRDARAVELARRALAEAQTLAGEVGGRSLALLCYRSALVTLARTLRAQRAS